MSSEAEKLAKKIFKSKNIKTIEYTDSGFQRRFKVVVFVPAEKADELIFAMASAGAGIIGNYSLCSFRTRGIGTFKGNENSNPAIGTKGNFETTEEIRLEMICNKENIDNVIEKIYDTHPYDEPAFDIYEVFTISKKQKKDSIILTFKKKTSVKNMLKLINPDIDLTNIPRRMKKIKVGKSIVDCSKNEELNLNEYTEKILYIKKNKNNLKAYLT